MDTEELVKTVEEVRQQCRFGKYAWQGLRASLNSMDNEKAFFYVHALLDRARQVSHFLWSTELSDPASDPASERRAAIRKVLKVQDDSVLNASELVVFADAEAGAFYRWLSSLDHHRYLGMNVMPQGTMSDFRQDTFLRSLDPDLFQFTWYDRTIDIRKIAQALHDVESVAESWLKRPSHRKAT